jgi:hypothetical protein
MASRRNNLQDPEEKEQDMLAIKPLATGKNKIKQNQLMKADVIPRHPSSVIFNGTSGSGKSTLLANLLTKKQFYKGYFKTKDIYLISPTGASDDMFEHLSLPESNICVEIKKKAEKLLNKLMAEQKKIVDSKGIEKAPKLLIIFEDIQSDARFMRCSAFLKSFLMNRHFGMSVWLCGQSFKLTPRACRLQANNIFCFQPTNNEREILVENYCPPGMSKNDFIAMIAHATDEPYSFMHINKRLGFDKRYRKNLGTILRMT